MTALVEIAAIAARVVAEGETPHLHYPFGWDEACKECVKGKRVAEAERSTEP
jgi:hypothetical protein